MGSQDLLRAIPSVDAAVRHAESLCAAADCPRPILVRTVREALDEFRRAIGSGHFADSSPEELRDRVLASLEASVARARRRSLVAVVNGTGVIIHTNLGRAPLSAEALAAVAEVACGYSNLEYDLGEGRRGSRDLIVRDAVCELTGGEDALVVNNNAAAVLLALDTLARGREVLVSRGELIEVGGSFRLPEVFEKSGATLVEVGTTNRTRIEDFQRAIRAQTAALMTAHWSNYAIVGFVDRVRLPELAALGARHGIPVIHDLGSGLLAPGESLGLAGEMSASDSLKAGVSVSTMSGDKLLGGPQAGIAIGKAGIIAQMRANPLARALRPCKLTLAALQATLGQYLSGHATSVPILNMLAADVSSLEKRALAIAAAVKQASGADLEVVDLESRVGGGAAPERAVPSKGLEIRSDRAEAEAITARMLRSARPVVARTNEGRVLIDLRTVFPTEDEVVAACITEALTAHGD
jgi:L-seryl-tRNA(Ser) seleniumtransferase